MLTGSLRLDALELPDLPFWNGNKSTSYPARTNRPSGGIKLNSPGFSRHLASLTQGWKTGSSMTVLKLCFPDGVDRVSCRSGTPESFEVNAMVPLANAARGLPEGAKVTDKVSIMSTYISFEVCRTLALLHGSDGALVFNAPDEENPAMPDVDNVEAGLLALCQF